MQPCDTPPPTGDTLGYLAFDYTVTLQSALAQCNTQLKALRHWGAAASTGQ